jgi:protein translocase SecG subunit
MSTVLLVLHIFVTLALIGLVLVQRSEGGGLGIGSSGGMGSFMGGRGTANLLTRATAVLATAFFVLSLMMAVLDRGAVQRIRRAASLHRRRLGIGNGVAAEGDAGALLAAGFPDRIAARRGAMDGAFRLASGQGARITGVDPLAKAPLLAVADLEIAGTEARIRMAAPLDRAVLEARFPERLRRQEGAAFDARTGAVLARRRLCFGPLVLEESPLPQADPAAMAARWAGALGLEAKAVAGGWRIETEGGELRFVTAADGRGDP